jgi:osmotically-inducible protein OsmY
MALERESTRPFATQRPEGQPAPRRAGFRTGAIELDPSQGQDEGPALADCALAAAVHARLLADPTTHGLDIRVWALNGVVVLRGVVSLPTDIEHAETLVALVDGVVEVRTRLDLWVG